MKIKTIELENFKKVSKARYEFGSRTSITGANGLGKTTIADAFFWVMFNKMMDGSRPDKIRPHKEDGKDIDFVTITAAVTLDIDGKEIIFKKVQNQKWTKPNGETEKRFDGNDNTYEIDGFPAKEKEYKEKIKSIIDENVFTFSTNAASFFKLDNKKRREKLFTLASDFKDDDIAKGNSEFSSLVGAFEDHSVEDHIAKYELAISKKKEEKEDIPVRIDEISKKLVDIDVAEIELAKSGIEKELSDIKEQEDKLDKVVDSLEEKTETIMQKKFELHDIERKANEELFSHRKELSNQIDTLKQQERDIKDFLALREKQIKDYLSEKEHLQAEKKELGAKYNELKASSFDDSKWIFDENSTICPNCGQKYPKDKISQIRAEFEGKKAREKNAFDNHKANAMKDTVNKGNSCNNRIKEIDREIAELKEQIKEKQAFDSSKIKSLQEKLDSLPSSVDLSNDEKYVSLKSEIDKAEESMQEERKVKDSYDQIESKKRSLNDELVQVECKLAISQSNKETEERIQELSDSEKQLAVEIAKLKGKLDILKRFHQAKVETLTDSINQHFTIIKWKMFEKQINGGYKEVCVPTVDGNDYGNGLNSGHSILAELDLLLTMQKINNVSVPIFLDNCERVDEWRVPDTECQLITMARTDSDKLNVEVIKE